MAWPSNALAHVKWFCGTADVSQPPVAISHVLSPLFLMVGIGFLVLVFAGLAADGWVARYWPQSLTSRGRFALAEEVVVRAGIGLYCLLLWDGTAIVPWGHIDEVILTPELLGHDRLIDALQIAVAVLVVDRRTCRLAAVPLLALLGEGVSRYGVFHMTDYVFFPGIAAYLALTAIGTPATRRWRTPLLSAGLAFGLMWTAIEKFLYPEWTMFVIAAHPDIGAGFPPSFVVVVAGFVEFTLAFFVMTGRGLVRVGAAAYAAIFIVAVPEFGHLDAVGHIPIVGILFVVCLHGASPLQRLFRIQDREPLHNAVAVSGLYLASLAAFFGMYYGLQWVEYG